MGHRLSKIVTRTGDAGSTGLATGGRIAKTHSRVQALGEVDELNCHIGVLMTHELPETLRQTLLRLQHELFDLGGELSMPGHAALGATHLSVLEADAEALNEKLPPLKEFVLPGGSAAAAVCHLARAVARRVERALWTLHEQEPVNQISLRYANRLSDFLFIAARTLARANGGKEVTWSRK